MEDMGSLLNHRSHQLPPQIAALKKYAKDNYDTDITVRVSRQHYRVTVQNGALAHRMRVDTADITATCKLDKPLVIHIAYQ